MGAGRRRQGQGAEGPGQIQAAFRVGNNLAALLLIIADMHLFLSIGPQPGRYHFGQQPLLPQPHGRLG